MREVIDCDTPLDYAQLYAQLLHEVLSGEPVYFTHAEEAAIQQHNRLFYQSSPIRECFVRCYEVSEGYVTGGEWLTATAIFQSLKRDMRGLVRNAAPHHAWPRTDTTRRAAQAQQPRHYVLGEEEGMRGQSIAH